MWNAWFENGGMRDGKSGVEDVTPRIFVLGQQVIDGDLEHVRRFAPSLLYQLCQLHTGV